MIWGGGYEGVSGLGTHVHLWWIDVNVWQNKYNIVKLKKKNLNWKGDFMKKGCGLMKAFVPGKGSV